MKSCANKQNIVFLPGWGFKSSVWKIIGDRLNQYNVHYLDLPNTIPLAPSSFPRTRESREWLEKTPTHPVNSRILLNKITDYLAKKTPENSIIVGWSLGGLFAINLCYRFPSNCRKLVLTASTPKFVTKGNEYGIEASMADDFRQLALKDIHTTIKSFIALVQYPNTSYKTRRYLNKNLQDYMSEKKSMLTYLDILFDTDLLKKYHSIPIPVLHFSGKNDAILNKQKSDSTNMASFVKMPGGHTHFLTHSEVFLEKLKLFIEK